MAQLLTGTRIYGTGTVDTQLFVSGTNSATSTTTGALQVVGGVGVGGNLYVGGTIFGSTISGTASTATNADNIKTVLSTSTSVFFPVFVDSNNATAGYEAVYSSSTFTIIPSSGNVGVGVATPTEKLHVAGNYILLKNTADSAAGAVFDSGSTVGQNTQILLRDRGSDKWTIRKNSANDFDIYGNAAGAVALTIFSSTNYIGIGTATPQSKLTVTGSTVPVSDSTGEATGVGTIRINNGSTALSSEGGIEFKIAGDSNGYGSKIQAINSSGSQLVFANRHGSAAWTERLRITNNGGIAFSGATNYGTSGQILQSNGDAAPTWISTGSLAAANATTATHLSGGVAGQIPYQTAPGVTSFLSTGTSGNVLVSNGSSAATYNNTLTLTGGIVSVSTQSGTLQVRGGFGLSGDAYIGGTIVQVGGTFSTLATTYNLINTTATTINFAGAATSLNVGATSGSTNVRNNLTVSGNLTVQGTTTIVDSTVTNISDPILTLGGGTGNTAPTADDNKDRGVAFKWVNDGGTTSTGFFGYDDSTGYFTYVQTATITNEVVSGTKGAMDVNLAGGTAMSIVYQSSPNNTAFLAASTSGYILQTNGTGSPPTWVSASGVSAGSATYADQIRTIAQTASAVYYPTFVDSNNASNAYESVYTTGTFVINPATGNVGMGTANPQRPLHVVSIGTATQGIAAFEAKASGFVIQDNGSQNGNVELVGYKQTSSTYHNILIRGSSSGLLVQNTTGNVGLGNLTPIAKLHIGAETEVNITNQSLFVQGSKTGYAGFKGLPLGQLFIYDDTASTAGSGGAIGFGANTGASQRTWIASINSERDSATNDATNYGGSLVFYTRPALATPEERVRITSAGGVAFGGAANYGSSGQILQSNGNAAPTWVSAISGSSAQVNTVLQTASASYYLTFVDSNNASATAESVYTTSSFQINPSTGNIQIGMTGQDYQPSSGGNHTLRLNALNTSSIGFHDSGSTIGNLKFSGAYGFEIGAYDGLYGPHNTILHGSVGVGTQNPTAKFTISNTGSTSAAFYADIGNPGSAITLFEHTGASTPVPFRFRKSGYSGASPNFGLFYLHMNDGTVGNGSNLYFNLNNSSGTEIEYAGLGAIIRSNTAASEQGDLALYVMQNGTGRTERMRITSAGAIAFNGASSYGSSGQVLQSNGNAPPTWINQSSITSGATSLTSTYVGFGSASNLLTGSSSLTWNGSNLYVNGGITSNSTSPFSLQSNGNAGTYNQTVIYANQNNTSGNTANGIFIERGRLTDGATAEIRSFVIGSRGGEIQLILNKDGNLGIGTPTPSGKLHLYQTSGGSNILTLDTNFVNGNAFAINPFITGISNGGLSIRDVNNAVDRLVIQYSTGNVGIGTTAPNDKLQVQTQSATAYDPTNDQGQYGSGAGITVTNLDETSQSFAQINLQVSGNAGRAVGRIVAIRTASATSDLAFVTENANTKAEKMRIFSNGNVSIGTTSTTNKFEVVGTAGQLFSVSDSFTGTIFSANDVSGIPSIEVLDTGLVKFAQYGGQVGISTGTVVSGSALSVYGIISTIGTGGEIRASSEITAYYSSDRRLKENIKLIENPITIIDQIRGVTFDWTDEHMARRGGEDGYFVRKHDIGVIAQEVQAVLPELVGTREDGYLAVKYEKLVPLLIEAVKEQQKTIETLTSEIKEIKEFLSSLKNN